MPNLTQISRLLRAMRQEAKAAKPAGNLDELLAGLPKASPEVEARVKAEIAERELAASEAKKVKPTDKTKGKAAIAEMKRILMTPEERAASEAQLREQGLQSFLEPSAVKERLYHGTSRPDLTEFKTGKMIKEKQYPGNTIEPWAVDNRDAVFLTPDPQFSSRYSGGDWEVSGGYTPTTYPVRVQVKNPWDYENPDHIEGVIQAYKEKYPLRRDKSGAVPSEESLRHHWFEKNVRELPLRERDNWSGVEKADLQEIIRSLGHDAFFVKEAGIKNLGVYDPRRIKSAIGNRGTYDITDPDITKAEGGLAMQAGGVPTFMKLIKKLTTDIKKAEKAGDLETSLAKRKELNKAIQSGVNDPLMPRAQPLTQAEIRMYAERMAPQVAGELTRGAGAKTVAGKSQKQFKREQTLPVDRKVLPGAVDPSAPLPYMTLEDQIDSVLLGLPGDPTLARVSLAGIGDVPFARAVTQHGGPRYGDENKLWASNLSAATGLLNAADRASRQFGDAPVIASYMKMPSGFGFAQHYLESLLQYQRPDLLNKAAREALEKDIRAGFVDDGKRVTFPNFPGFDDLGAVAQAAESDSILRKHIAAKLGTSEKYGLRSAADVQFAISHPELTNLETGASGFTLGELHAKPLALSSHPTYEYDILGKVLGQTQYPTPYDLMYRDQLELIRNNPEAPEFNTLKMLGARQKIDDQLVNEINEYQERMRQLLGRKKGGAVKKAEGGAASLTDLPDEVTPANWREHLQNNVLADARALLGVKDGGAIDLNDLIEQRLKKKQGGAIDLNDLIEWKIAKNEHRKMKEGGAVKMQGGGNPGEVSGEMFKPKPLTIPEPITDLVEALRRKFEQEKRSMRKPGAVQDVLMRGPVAAYAGAPADIVGMGGELLDFVQKKIPVLRKPASVMDTGPEKTPPMGYAPAFPLSPEGSYGTTAAQELMGKAGLTTGEERPLFEMGAMVAAPVAGYAGLKAGKALAPTAMEMLDVELANMMKPYQMAVAPEGKAGKLKAPANPVGFYNPAEKAALNLQRKKGPGSAFISDMKKQPGVTDERIAELGLTDLASNPNLTREEVIAAAEQNRIPLRESVRRPYQESDEYSETADALKESIRYREGGIQQVQAELDRVRATAPDSPLVGQYERKIETMRESIARDQQKLEAAKPSLYGPDSHPDYNMPGGENYREIRVALPNTQKKKEIHEWFDPKTQTSKQFATQEEAIADKGKPASAYIMKRYEMEGAEPFYHKTHHGDEPNVLFHLRVADHVDEEGKKGLLIDELQSDWHQTGREKGYGRQPSTFMLVNPKTSGAVGNFATKEEAEKFLKTSPRAEEFAQGKFFVFENKGKVVVPDAPFKDNWYQLGLKRAIKEAADTGMDRVYLTTGARQADRYDLRKHIGYLSIKPRQNNMLLINATKDGDQVIWKEVPKDQLADYVGKDMAKKAISDIDAGNPAQYSGLDLKVGGEGMKQYYDKTYKNYLEKYAKKHGGKLGMTKIAEGEPVYFIDLTDAMRESAKKGQSYAFGGGVFNTDPDITDSGRIIPHNI